MLQYYILSIIAWWIITYASIFALQNKIIENGWLYDAPQVSKSEALMSLLLSCAIPLFRIAVLIGIFVMSKYTKEEVEDWSNKS